MRPEPVAVIRRISDGALAPHAELYGVTEPDRALSLARALATSPAWARLSAAAAMVVRPRPHPMLAVIGSLPKSDLAVVEALGAQVDAQLARLRPISHREAEQGCEVIAEQLRNLLGDDILAASTIVGIPRGGLIVAGLLAYVLKIPPERVGVMPPPEGRLLLVDDCVLSGTRLGRWLHANPAVSAISVHLASVPSCRDVIVAQHPRVTACIAAIDLTDHAPEHDPGWHRRWRKRSPDDLWTGDPDHVVFPWNEPDSVVWNAGRERAERAWRVVPPSWCLKNRAQGGEAPDHIQVNSTGEAGPHSPAISAMWAELDGAVIVANLGDERAIRLTGVAAVCWRELVLHGRADAAVAAVTAIYGAPGAVVRSDVARLVERLAARGLLRSSGHTEGL